MDVRILPTAADLAEAVADFVAARRSAAPGGFTVGLAGGSTPRAAYRSLSRRRIAWDGVDLWLSDERWVSPDHADSNGRMVLESLGDPARFHRPQWDLGDPETAAAAYEITLDRIFAGRRPDLVLIGMGADGHTASLFPGTRALREEHRSYVANWVASLDAWRLTATLPLLHRACTLAFIVAGEAKASTMARVASGDPSLPAVAAASGAGEAVWFLDAAAAAGLPERGGAAPQGGTADS